MEVTLNIIEPILIKAGDNKLKINGSPSKVDCRVISEWNYQLLLHLVRELHKIKEK
jgi:hypothetical protein